MFTDTAFTKENLNLYLNELAKEFRRLNGTEMPAEIVLIGGAAVLANYGFREMTYDIDALIVASSVMKQAINNTGDRLGLPNGWLNTDFKNTSSYSNKLIEVSVYYKTFSNVLTIRTVTAEYLVAMKLMSGRQYKNDLSDVVGILREHKKCNTPISKDMIDKAVCKLYGQNALLPDVSREFIDSVFLSGDYESVYLNIKESERMSKEAVLTFIKDKPDKIKEQDIAYILEMAKQKKKNKNN